MSNLYIRESKNKSVFVVDGSKYGAAEKIFDTFIGYVITTIAFITALAVIFAMGFPVIFKLVLIAVSCLFSAASLGGAIPAVWAYMRYPDKWVIVKKKGKNFFMARVSPSGVKKYTFDSTVDVKLIEYSFGGPIPIELFVKKVNGICMFNENWIVINDGKSKVVIGCDLERNDCIRLYRALKNNG